MGALRKRLHRPRPGSVIATLALFLALGGGAFAFSGSGTLQKAHEVGLAGPTIVDAEVIRTVAGTANVEAYCDGTNTPFIGIRNKSGKPMFVASTASNEFDVGSLANNSGSFVSFTQDELIDYHLSPAQGSKAPQASITLSLDYTPSCETTRVAVINVSTVG